MNCIVADADAVVAVVVVAVDSVAVGDGVVDVAVAAAAANDDCGAVDCLCSRSSGPRRSPTWRDERLIWQMRNFYKLFFF